MNDTPVYRLPIKQGADFSYTFRLFKVDVQGRVTDEIADLSGYTGAVSELRKAPGAPLLATFDTTIDVGDGSVTIALPTPQTNALDFTTARLDIFLIKPGGNRDKVLVGAITFERSITQWQE
ncbi:hypothetical protein [Asticcacaulis sp.]|uniref:hypothetical protein n=1 Tax=Asticcacaulis sp. TaxID=1872648 RepID=UPI0039E42495